MNEVLVDTNVLVYLHDAAAPAKQRRAAALLGSLASDGGGRLCAQVLGEYLSVVMRKFRHVIDAASAQHQAEKFSELFAVHHTTAEVVLEAVGGVRHYGFSYYDAQIWAVAKLNGIPLVYSEDFTHGREVEGVRFENPFRDIEEFEVPSPGRSPEGPSSS